MIASLSTVATSVAILISSYWSNSPPRPDYVQHRAGPEVSSVRQFLPPVQHFHFAAKRL